MRARIREPGDSLRWFFYGLSAICFSAAAIFRFEIGPPLDPVFFMGAALLFMSPIFQQRTAWRNAEIETQPGRLQISRRGIFGKRESTIAIKNVIGASVAPVDGHVNLALGVGSRARHPVIIAFENDADAAVVTKALGIGSTGFGVVVWERAPSLLHHAAADVRIIATVTCAAICVWAKISDPFAANLDVQSIYVLAIVACLAFVFAVPLVIARRTLSLSRSGLVAFEDRIKTLSYPSIASIALKNQQIVIERLVIDNEARSELATIYLPYVKRSLFLPGLDDVDTTMIIGQTQAAADRTRNTTRPEYDEQVRTLLSNRYGESTEAWVRRLDELADSWRASPPRYGESIGYRHALWQAVEDHDCDDVVRALAARMLTKLEPDDARPKLRVIAEAVRTSDQAKRFRLAMEPEVEPMAESIASKSRR